MSDNTTPAGESNNSSYRLVPGQGGQRLYSHRNGETEPPTIEGDFWFAGNLHHYEANYWHNTKSLLRVERHWRTDDLFLPGEECNHELTDAEGQWYGPVIPPWDTQPTGERSSE